MSFIEEWIETEPEDRSPLKLLGVVIRGLKAAIRERMGVEHIIYVDGDDTKDDTGRHRAGECSVCYVGTKETFPSSAVKGALALDGTNLYIYNGGWILVLQNKIHSKIEDNNIILINSRVTLSLNINSIKETNVLVFGNYICTISDEGFPWGALYLNNIENSHVISQAVPYRKKKDNAASEGVSSVSVSTMITIPAGLSEVKWVGGFYYATPRNISGNLYIVEV